MPSGLIKINYYKYPWYSTIISHLGQKNKIKCVFPIDPNIFYAPKNNRSTKSANTSPFPTSTNRGLTVAILTLSDERLIETDFLKTCFLFEFSSFPCTFDRCLEPVLMIQQSYNRRDVNNPFHMEREVRPLSRNPNFQNTIAVYIFWKVGKQLKKIIPTYRP
jgi:hypothetical protein